MDRLRFWGLWLLLLISTQGYGQADTSLFPMLSGDDLLQKIQNDFTPGQVLTYGEARDALMGDVYKLKDSVTCVYTGYTLYVAPNVDPSSYIFRFGSDNGINTEHTYPRSKGSAEEPALADMHHLFPTRSYVNEARSNFPLREIKDETTVYWYLGTEERRTKPQSQLDQYSEYRFGSFEPREDHKGNVARAIFYFYTIYREEAIAADRNFFESQRPDLCNWTQLDPVDSLEYARSFAIASYQDQRPNPFVLDCSLAQRLYCPESTNTCGDAIVSTIATRADFVSDLQVYPNPSPGQTQIQFQLATSAEVELQVINLLGQRKYIRTPQQVPAGSYQWDLSLPRSGLYTLLLQVRDQKAVQVFSRKVVVE